MQWLNQSVWLYKLIDAYESTEVNPRCFFIGEMMILITLFLIIKIIAGMIWSLMAIGYLVYVVHDVFQKNGMIK